MKLRELAFLAVFSISTAIFGQTAEELTNLKTLGECFFINKTSDNKLIRIDYDGKGGSNKTTLAENLSSGYIGLNKSGTLVTFLRGDNKAGDIFVIGIDGKNERKVNKEPLPNVSNLKFAKTSDYMVFTSGTKVARPGLPLTAAAWTMDLDGKINLIVEKTISGGSDYMGDVQIYDNLFAYRFSSKVYIASFTYGKTGISEIDQFGTTCEQDFSWDGKYFITNENGHTTVNIHQSNGGTSKWTHNIKRVGLLQWKTDEYRWTNNSDWIVANPEEANAKGTYVFNWQTGVKIRVEFDIIGGGSKNALFFGKAPTTSINSLPNAFRSQKSRGSKSVSNKYLNDALGRQIQMTKQKIPSLPLF